MKSTMTVSVFSLALSRIGSHKSKPVFLLSSLCVSIKIQLEFCASSFKCCNRSQLHFAGVPRMTLRLEFEARTASLTILTALSANLIPSGWKMSHSIFLNPQDSRQCLRSPLSNSVLLSVTKVLGIPNRADVWLFVMIYFSQWNLPSRMTSRQ